MTLNLYAIYDTGIESVVTGTFFTAPTDHAAMRYYHTISRQIHQDFFPDYKVFCLGRIDMDKGIITSDVKPVSDMPTIMSLFAEKSDA